MKNDCLKQIRIWWIVHRLSLLGNKKLVTAAASGGTNSRINYMVYDRGSWLRPVDSGGESVPPLTESGLGQGGNKHLQLFETWGLDSDKILEMSLVIPTLLTPKIQGPNRFGKGGVFWFPLGEDCSYE